MHKVFILSLPSPPVPKLLTLPILSTLPLSPQSPSVTNFTNIILVHTMIPSVMASISGGFRGVSEVSTEPPLWAAPSCDDRLTGTPSLATELRKLLLWLTLACFSRKIVQKSIGWAGTSGSCSQMIKMGVVFSRKWAWLLKFCARKPKTEPPFRIF